VTVLQQFDPPGIPRVKAELLDIEERIAALGITARVKVA
jgi:hypothetical protein